MGNIVGTTNEKIWHPDGGGYGPWTTKKPNWLDQVWNTKCDVCGLESTTVHTTKNGMKLCIGCANAANTELSELVVQKEACKKELRSLEKQIKDLKKTRDALAKEVEQQKAEISAREAQEGAVEILEEMRDLTSSL